MTLYIWLQKFQEAKVPGSEYSSEQKFQVMKIPGPFHSGERKFQGARRSGNASARKQQFQGMNWPGSYWNFHSRERIGPGTKRLLWRMQAWKDVFIRLWDGAGEQITYSSFVLLVYDAVHLATEPLRCNLGMYGTHYAAIIVKTLQTLRTRQFGTVTLWHQCWTIRAVLQTLRHQGRHFSSGQHWTKQWQRWSGRLHLRLHNYVNYAYTAALDKISSHILILINSNSNEDHIKQNHGAILMANYTFSSKTHIHRVPKKVMPKFKSL